MCETSTTTKPEVVSQLVNEMRALIQEIKTVIEAVMEKLSKDPNISCNKPRETGKDRQEELRGPHFWGDFCCWATTDPTQKENKKEPFASTCQTGKIQMNIKMKNQEAHSKCSQEQSYLYESNTAMLRDQQNPYEEPIV